MVVAGRRKIGPYELVEPIGHGGSSVVYRALDAAGQHVAVKVIAGAHAADPTFRARFRQEAELISRLGHPHILRVLDSGEAAGAEWGAVPEDVAYLVTEFMPGGSLADRLAAPGDVHARCLTALAVAQQIGAALDWAHAAGVLHRDVKPSNVLIAADGRYVLGDFGLARLLESNVSLHLTATGLVAGTPAYMSPEQAMGQPAEPRTDVYSLAVVLFEILTGRVPFDAEAPMAMMLAHVHQPPPAPREVSKELPESVSRAVWAALAKEPDDRPETAGRLAAALHVAVARAYGEAAITTGTYAQLPPDLLAADEALLPAGGGSAPRFLTIRPQQRDRAARRPRAKGRWSASVPRYGPSARRWRLPVLVASVVAGGALLATGAVSVALGPARPYLSGAVTQWMKDRVPLGVSEALPRDFSRSQQLRPTIIVRFTQPMDQLSVQEQFRLESADGREVIPPGALDFLWEGQILQVTPLVDLAYSTTYRYVIDSSARDLEGRELGGPVERHFTTVAEPPKLPALVAAPAQPASPVTELPRSPAPVATPSRAAPTVQPTAPPTQRSAPAPTATLYAPATLPAPQPGEAHVAGIVMDEDGTARLLEGSEATGEALPEPTPQPPATVGPLPASTVAAPPTATSRALGTASAGSQSSPAAGSATAGAGAQASASAQAGLTPSPNRAAASTGTPSAAAGTSAPSPTSQSGVIPTVAFYATSTPTGTGHSTSTTTTATVGATMTTPAATPTSAGTLPSATAAPTTPTPTSTPAAS